jgi:hypothetical protein
VLADTKGFGAAAEQVIQVDETLRPGRATCSVEKKFLAVRRQMVSHTCAATQPTHAAPKVGKYHCRIEI